MTNEAISPKYPFANERALKKVRKAVAVRGKPVLFTQSSHEEYLRELDEDERFEVQYLDEESGEWRVFDTTAEANGGSAMYWATICGFTPARVVARSPVLGRAMAVGGAA